MPAFFCGIMENIKQEKGRKVKFNQKILLQSTVLLTTLSAATAQADMVWTPRSVEAIQSELIHVEDTVTYTIRYGDTLSTIAEAMGIDMTILVKVNQIANADLIFPDTVLRTTINEQEEVTSIEIQAPTPENQEETISATVDLEDQEIQVEDKVVELEEVVTPADDNQQPAEEVVEVPVEPASEQVQAEEPVSEMPAVASEPSPPAVTEVPLAVATELVATKVENIGLQPQTAIFKEEVASLFGISQFSGYRAGDSGDHGKGLAIDFMVSSDSALGDQVADYAVAQMAAKRISYIIWKQRFYSPYPSIYGPDHTWNLMPDRGSVTENHYDHVHVSFYE